MPKASLIIRFIGNKIELSGNEDLLWYINEKVRRKTLRGILNAVKKFKSKKKSKGKMNIIMINLPDKYYSTIEEFREHFNFIIEKSYQTKITKFFKN